MARGAATRSIYCPRIYRALGFRALDLMLSKFDCAEYNGIEWDHNKIESMILN